MLMLLSSEWSFISIHSPRMGRDALNAKMESHQKISIHSPRMGRDPSLHIL